MKFLIDENLHPDLVRGMEAFNKVCVHVLTSEIDLQGATDETIVKYAIDNDYVIITCNGKHFIPLVNEGKNTGLVVIRDGNLSAPVQGFAISQQLDAISKAIYYIDTENPQYIFLEVISSENRKNHRCQPISQ